MIDGGFWWHEMDPRDPEWGDNNRGPWHFSYRRETIALCGARYVGNDINQWTRPTNACASCLKPLIGATT